MAGKHFIIIFVHSFFNVVKYNYILCNLSFFKEVNLLIAFFFSRSF